MDIDLVYLWVNGNDPKWVAKHDAYSREMPYSERNCTGRYADNGELKYSLRSVERYAPWIRNIFIVTDRQVPEWLNTAHPRIHIVDHSDIMPPECLPCFNSVVIEHHLHLIPGLSEHFLYANDDTLLNKPVTPQTFFGTDSFPIIRMRRHYFRKLFVIFRTKIVRHPLNTYAQTIHNAALLVEKKFGIYYNGRTHHCIDAYLKSSYCLTRQLFNQEIEATTAHRIRSPHDIQRNLYAYTALATRCGHLTYVDNHTSLNIRIHWLHSKSATLFDDHFEQYAPTFVCLNDTQYSTADDRAKTHSFLQKLFPNKSPFEL